MNERSRSRPIQTIDRHIGAQIRKRRRWLGLTLAQMADRLGITYQQLHRNEIGINHIPASRLPCLASCLDVTVDYFFDGLRDEQILPLERADSRFLQLAEWFVRLSEEDKRAVIGIARVFANRRERLQRGPDRQPNANWTRLTRLGEVNTAAKDAEAELRRLEGEPDRRPKRRTPRGGSGAASS